MSDNMSTREIELKLLEIANTGYFENMGWAPPQEPQYRAAGAGADGPVFSHSQIFSQGTEVPVAPPTEQAAASAVAAPAPAPASVAKKAGKPRGTRAKEPKKTTGRVTKPKKTSSRVVKPKKVTQAMVRTMEELLKMKWVDLNIVEKHRILLPLLSGIDPVTGEKIGAAGVLGSTPDYEAMGKDLHTTGTDTNDDASEEKARIETIARRIGAANKNKMTPERISMVSSSPAAKIVTSSPYQSNTVGNNNAIAGSPYQINTVGNNVITGRPYQANVVGNNNAITSSPYQINTVGNNVITGRPYQANLVGNGNSVDITSVDTSFINDGFQNIDTPRNTSELTAQTSTNPDFSDVFSDFETLNNNSSFGTVNNSSFNDSSFSINPDKLQLNASDFNIDFVGTNDVTDSFDFGISGTEGFTAFDTNNLSSDSLTAPDTNNFSCDSFAPFDANNLSSDSFASLDTDFSSDSLLAPDTNYFTDSFMAGMCGTEDFTSLDDNNMNFDSFTSLDTNNMSPDSFTVPDTTNVGSDSFTAFDANNLSSDSFATSDPTNVSSDSFTAFDANNLSTGSITSLDTNTISSDTCTAPDTTDINADIIAALGLTSSSEIAAYNAELDAFRKTAYEEAKAALNITTATQARRLTKPSPPKTATATQGLHTTGFNGMDFSSYSLLDENDFDLGYDQPTRGITRPRGNLGGPCGNGVIGSQGDTTAAPQVPFDPSAYGAARQQEALERNARLRAQGRRR